MQICTLLTAVVLLLSSPLMLCAATNQQDAANSQSSDTAQNSSNGETIEGTVVSISRATLTLRIEDDNYQLFTYAPGMVRSGSITQGARVRVVAGAADENGVRAARNVTLITATTTGGVGNGTTADKGAQAAPVPEKVKDVEADIKRESRRWRLGVRGGAAFDPELFTFGVQSQIGPIFHPRVLFRPNAEFAFGEVTDLISLNLEGIYRFSSKQRREGWTPYVGAGPALIFIHQSLDKGRDINFSNFDYETGFNVLAGLQSRRGTFVELKTSLWSGPAPTLRLIVGYNF